jgi:hypothetical protein
MMAAASGKTNCGTYRREDKPDELHANVAATVYLPPVTGTLPDG